MDKTKFLFILLIFVSIQVGYSQYASTKINKKHEAYTDSLKNVEYKALLPIWGQKVYEKGFDLPYPTGLMVNYMYIDQGLIVDDMRLGIKTDNLDIPLTDADFIQFSNNSVVAETVVVRPDVWILPFLNVYGVFGVGTSETEVNLSYPISMKTVVEQRVNTSGVGLTAAAGLGPVWLALDGNVTWNKPELLEDPVKVETFGIRMGQNFVNKDKPYRNFGIWIGAMSVKMGKATQGEITLNDVIPQETWDRADEIVQNYNYWYDNVATIKQKAVADLTLSPIMERLDAADGSAIIRYGLKKSVQQKWNGIIGAQYQPNKNWMFRTEAGIVGNRKSLLLSVNYRFLLRR